MLTFIHYHWGGGGGGRLGPFQTQLGKPENIPVLSSSVENRAYCIVYEFILAILILRAITVNKSIYCSFQRSPRVHYNLPKTPSEHETVGERDPVSPVVLPSEVIEMEERTEEARRRTVELKWAHRRQKMEHELMRLRHYSRSIALQVGTPCCIDHTLVAAVMVGVTIDTYHGEKIATKIGENINFVPSCKYMKACMFSCNFHR